MRLEFGLNLFRPDTTTTRPKAEAANLEGKHANWWTVPGFLTSLGTCRQQFGAIHPYVWSALALSYIFLEVGLF